MADFPLPLVWTAPFGWDCALWDAPLVSDDEVIVRAGPRLVGLDPTTGAQRWTRELVGATLGGNVFDRAGDVLLADATVKRDQLLVGATRERVVWQHRFGGAVARDGVAIVDGAIAAVVTGERDVWLARIDPQSGGATKTVLPAGGSTLALAGGELIAMSPSANAGAPGAYVVASDGSAARVVRTGDVWSGAIAGGALVSVGGRKRTSYTVDARTLADGTVRWADECFGDSAALDGDDVAHAVRRGDSTELVVRAAASGDIRWRAALGNVEPAVISFAASVVLVSHMTGMMIVRRSDGHVLGNAPGIEGMRGAVAGGVLYLGAERELLAARLPG